MDDAATELVERARAEIVPGPNRFLDLLDSGRMPRERLKALAGEQFHILRSDLRSFAHFVTRFPDPPAGDFFLGLAGGESAALRLLPLFGAAVGMSQADLRGYRPRPMAQAYPAFVAQRALTGGLSGMALAMLANLDEWGGYCARTANALVSQYDLGEDEVDFFRFFATTPPGFAEQAAAVVAQGLRAGEDAEQALHDARMLHAYESAFWESLAHND
ncbi:hypothetical protein NDR87_31820 [Nocardia sp. CDC159]|uniref:Thiaminase-2/PQQC domain-containing protein n=1 Tax=Nocardia pulmonis TaxID=2951408 RepID=A0A9X2EC05_9NOCA|nr:MULTISPECIES: hypothetical protein [Nocardia]MCM6778079.1 hypothetical protein [Nocardia pulmonis]MCM6790968.1 hypothetical protein [Nocardia sp. CDC159]